MAKKKRAGAEGDSGPAYPLTTGGVAKLLGVSASRLDTVLRTTPELGAAVPQVGGRRMWRAEDVAALRERLEVLERRRPRRGPLP